MTAPHFRHSAMSSATARPAFTISDNPPCCFCSFESFKSMVSKRSRQIAKRVGGQVYPVESRGARLLADGLKLFVCMEQFKRPPAVGAAKAE